MDSLFGKEQVVGAFRAGLYGLTARFSLLWLSAANLVGLWLSLLLACPEVGALSGPIGYGKWMALHLDWQLYGWCSLPVVGVLLNRWLPCRASSLVQARWAFRLWSWVLALGGAWWLQGESSGKLFLDWSGLARICFVAVLAGLWALLALALFRRWRIRCAARGREGSAAPSVLDWLVLAALGAVPPAIWTATKPQLYPPINPTSGGPTGTNLLGSTLAVVLILGLLPHLLEIRCRSRRIERLFWAWFLAESLLYVLLGHGDQSNRDGKQIAGLASLVVWIPLLPLYLHSCGWAVGSRLWGISFAGWWTALVVTGLTFFLPGFLDSAKFSHLLVAHAHIAMAGVLTSLNMLLLLQLEAGGSVDPDPLQDPVRFWLWHAGLFVHLFAVGAVGWNEAQTPGWLWHHAVEVRSLYWLRVVAGACMAGVSLSWLFASFRSGEACRDDR